MTEPITHDDVLARRIHATALYLIVLAFTLFMTFTAAARIHSHPAEPRHGTSISHAPAAPTTGGTTKMAQEYASYEDVAQANARNEQLARQLAALAH